MTFWLFEILKLPNIFRKSRIVVAIGNKSNKNFIYCIPLIHLQQVLNNFHVYYHDG